MTADPAVSLSRAPSGRATGYLCFSRTLRRNGSTDEQMPANLLDYLHASTRRR